VTAVIAERELGCESGPAHIRVFTPQPDRGDWRCDYEITWPTGTRRSYAMGVDSFQALHLAMLSISTEVEVSDPFKAGQLKLFDEPVTTIAALHQRFPIHYEQAQ
jgi:hypothetical protein